MPFCPAKEIEDRIQKLQGTLNQTGVSLFITTNARELLYYTGSIQPLYLFVPQKGEPLTASRRAFGRIAEESLIKRSEKFASSKDLKSIIDSFQITSNQSIGLSFDALSYSAYQRITQFFPGNEFKDLSWNIRTLRMIKSAWEVEKMRQCADGMSHAINAVTKSYTPGMSELEISSLIEQSFRLHGLGENQSRQEGVNFGYGITSSGINSLYGSRFDGVCAGRGLSPASPYGATADKIEKSAPIIMDYSATYAGYHCDQTRMGSMGKPLSQALDAYNAMLSIEDILLKKIKPGMKWREAWEISSAEAARLGYADTFMGYGSDRVFFVGHGVGLELDEPPFLAPKMENEFEQGMTIAIEPKVSLPGIGVVGIEDTILVGESENKYITYAPRDWTVLKELL